jgi:hypothetical protein
MLFNLARAKLARETRDGAQAIHNSGAGRGSK